MQVQRQRIGAGERVRYLTFDRRTVRNAADARYVDRDAGTILARGAEPADDEISLRDRINFTVHTPQRRDQQRAAAQALGVRDR